jgi:tRNA dimethylallyltransferase
VRVLALFGPTAVGKTAVAVAVADRLRAQGQRAVAVSADALQLYRGLEVLTGAPTPQQRARLEHRLVGVLDLHETSTVGAFAARAHAEVDALLGEGAVPIVLGGTGLYLRAALADLRPPPPVPAELRERWLHALEERGPQALHGELASRDPEAAARIGPGDRQRVVRALELHDVGARLPSPDESRLWTDETRHPTRLVGLVCDRAELDRRIEARVEAMVAAGVADEVRRAAARGAASGARQALGFEALLRGDVEAMKRETRRYARRQLTWMRKLPGAELVDVTGRAPEDVAALLLP